MKEYTDLSRYYSIRYDIWNKDIADVYEKLNGVLFDVQDKFIINHEFLENGLRVPDAEELEEDILNIYNQILDNHINAEEIQNREEQLAVSAARVLLRDTFEKFTKYSEIYATNYENVVSKANGLANFDESFYAKALAVSKDYFKAGMLSENKLSNNDFAIADSIRTAVGKYNVNIDAYKPSAENVYKVLKAAYDNKRIEILEAALLADLESQVVAFVESTVAAAGDDAALKTVATSYLGNRANANDINAMIEDLKALGTDATAIKDYFDGRDDHYSKFIDQLISSIMAAGTSPSKITEAFTMLTKAYKKSSAINDLVVSVVNVADGGAANYADLLKDYSDAKLEEAADDHEAIVAYNDFMANYYDILVLYNAYAAGLEALSLSASTNAVYTEIYDVILAKKSTEVFASIYEENGSYIDEIVNGYNEYTVACVAYDSAIADLVAVKESGYVDRYVYALATRTAIESEEVGYDLENDPYKYYLNAKNLVATNPQYSRTSAVFQTGEVMGNDYNSIDLKYNEAVEDLVKVANALEIIYTAELGRTDGKIENSLVWQEATEYEIKIKAMFADMEVIYNEVVGEDAIVSLAVENAKKIVAATGLDETFAEEADAAIEKNKPVIEEEKPDDIIIVDDADKYNTKNIVAVTYGTYNDKGEAVAYKTVLLNYNNYSVRITYNGMEYTISAYEYAVINLNK